MLTAASPLQIDGRALDIHIALARHGVPVHAYSMSIAGATSPVTLAGSVVQGVAEFLGAATALQVAAPGARLVFCFGSGVLDMLRTTFSMGNVESAQMGAMATEVGHFLGVPTLNPGFSTDSKQPGLQAGYEKALKTAGVCAANPDIVSGWGLLDSHNTMYLPQSVVDNEIAAMVRRLHGRVEVSRRHPGRRVDRQGRPRRRLPRGARRRRSASAPASTTCRRSPTAHSYEKWVEDGVTENDVAEAEVERLLAKHAERSCLEADKIDELAAICGVDDESVRRAHRE